jgi:hypothetical protein
MLKCYNGHRWDHAGCAGCHYAFHVVTPGTVAGGRLVPPEVDGPKDCVLCHDARHQVPVLGCLLCEESFKDSVHKAMAATKEVRQEIWGLRFLHWFVGWHTRVAGWLTLLAGGGWGDWFRRSDGSQNWFQPLLLAALIPLVQWLIRRRIARRRGLLPRLGPKGEVLYGSKP